MVGTRAELPGTYVDVTKECDDKCIYKRIGKPGVRCRS
jgi:hypothetical protein